MTNETINQIISYYDNSSVFSVIDQIVAKGVANDNGEVAWGMSSAMTSLSKMYKATNDMKYLDKLAYSVDKVMDMRDDRRGVVTTADGNNHNVTKKVWRVTNSAYGKWFNGDRQYYDSCVTGRIALDSIYLIPFQEIGDFGYFNTVQTANILKPMIALINILDASGELWQRYESYFTREELLIFIKESIAEHDNEFQEVYSIDGTKLYGIYEWPKNFYKYDEIYWRIIGHEVETEDTIPCNQMFSMGTVLVQMYELTGEDQYREKAIDLAKAYRRILSSKNDGYVWIYRYINYYDNARAEDISHGVLSIEFAHEYMSSGLPANSYTFNSQSMIYFSRTYMNNLFIGEITGDREYDYYSLVNGEEKGDYIINWGRSNATLWTMYSIYEPRIYEANYNICSHTNYNGIANLVLYNSSYKPTEIVLSEETLKYNYDNNLSLKLENTRMLGDFIGYKLYQIDGDTFQRGYFSLENKHTEDEWLDFNNFRTQSTKDVIFEYWSFDSGNLITGPSLKLSIPVVGETLYVSHREDIPVLLNEDIKVKVTDKPIIEPQPDGYIYQNIEGCTIELSHVNLSSVKLLTDADGMTDIDVNIDNTSLIRVIAYKDGYFPDTSYIEPYMWSTIPDAMGPSSSNHIIEYVNPTDGITELKLLYSDGTDIRAWLSEDFGETWRYLAITGQGTDVSATNLGDNGVAAMWKSDINWTYSYSYSPWVPIDTNYFDLLNAVMPSITTNHTTGDSIWFAGLYEHQINSGNYGILYSSFKYDQWKTTVPNELITTAGEYNTEIDYLAIPQANPSIGAKDWSGVYAPMFAFEDKNGEIIKKEYNPNYSFWDLIANQSNTSMKSCNPYVNPKSYTDNIKLVWQEEVALNSYRIYLDGARFAYDNTETDKRYPKIKEKILTYIEDGNKMVVCPKLIKSNYSNIEINSGGESIFNPEIAMYTTTTGALTKINVRSVYTVKKDDCYRIETSYDRVVSEDYTSALIGNEITLTTPTLITTTSYLKDYLPSGDKQKVERISGTYNGLNRYKDYIVEIKTTNNNKNQPYVVERWRR